MKFLAISALASLVLNGALGADVQYSVIAFPEGNQNVGVSVGGQVVQLQKSSAHPNIFSGAAPFGSSYQYAIMDGQTNHPESTTRKLAEGVTSTGNEFFNRSQTVYDVPALPQAFNPVYPTLYTNLNNANEVATIIMSVNASQLDAFHKNPLEKLKEAEVTQLAYINSKEVHQFQGAGIKTSGQSTKDFSKQSWAIDLNKYNKGAANKSLLFGRTTLKLRAEETDATFAREKLVFDMLEASGAATLSGSWVRVFINNEAFGLFLMIDDASTHFIDNVLHGGDWKYPYTGATFKGNALADNKEGNLAYEGPDLANYNKDLYKLADNGEDKSINKTNSQHLIMEFTQRLSQIDPIDAQNAQNPGSIANLIDSPEHTLRHMAINFMIGSWDGFWYQASNYYLNQDLNSKKWTLITYDFDETYGNGIEDPKLNTVAYQNYSRPGSKRPLVDVFLKNTYYIGQFETILKTIVKRFFKPSVMDARLKAWSEMLHEDIAWSRAIPGKSQGEKTKFGLKDFQDGLLGNNSETISISQWISRRSAALTQQLNFQDNDDLPALPAYNDGTVLDANGNVVKANGVSPNNNTNTNTNTNTSSQPTTNNNAQSAGHRLTMGTLGFLVSLALVLF
ncbi:coth protein-domain-containing protein [Sporodiniella umbellata]|nr:coth protein-domain-containing protein [Sporodiniella umbellata]